MSLIFVLAGAVVLGLSYFLFVVAKNETGIVKYAGYTISGILVLMLLLTPILITMGVAKLPAFLK